MCKATGGEDTPELIATQLRFPDEEEYHGANLPVHGWLLTGVLLEFSMFPNH